MGLYGIYRGYIGIMEKKMETTIITTISNTSISTAIVISMPQRS